MSASIASAVLGATGYVGGELLRLISEHPDFELAAAVSDSRAGDRIASVFPHLAPAFGNAVFASHDDWTATVARGADLALFSAAPHGASAAIIAAALKRAGENGSNVHVVDVSADFRYQERKDYEAVYGIEHGAPQLLAEFACAVPEHLAGSDAPHVGHPGCFATAALLATVPLVRSGLVDGDIFVSGITGSTGSGRQPQPGTHHPERHSNLYAYKPLAHRHAPEIERLVAQASGHRVGVSFVPHSGPFARGIYVTVQARTVGDASPAALRAAFEDAYAGSPFVGIVDGTPRLKDVVASNYARIGIAGNDRACVVTCAIDNLVKGAAGGAVQWMNRLWRLPETAGLTSVAPAWT